MTRSAKTSTLALHASNRSIAGEEYDKRLIGLQAGSELSRLKRLGKPSVRTELPSEG